MISNQIGSEWRIWDLHVHSPASYNGDYAKFIQNINKSKASVIGINDYNTIKGYEEIIKIGGINKQLIPIIEFRMNNVLQAKSQSSSYLHHNFHIIFNNDETELPLENINTWLNAQTCYNNNGDRVLFGNYKGDIKDIKFDYNELISSLKEEKLYGINALVWMPYNEYGGIEKIDPINDSHFKTGLIKGAHFIGSSTLSTINFFKTFKYPKACIKGSDSHKINYPFGQLQDKDSRPTDKYCWILGDMSFNTLKQSIIETDRVFIGDTPNLINRVNDNGSKFIKSLKINKIKQSKNVDTWFEEFELKFNKSLVAIIGKKGNGKSAIADILGLGGNSHQDPNNYSFLTNKKFRKSKPINLSKHFSVSLEWEDNTTSFIENLNTNVDKKKPERVKYIPQNFLEKVCTDIESEVFEAELKKIIFSHIPVSNKFEKTSLDELIDYKSNILQKEINKITSSISSYNELIINFESQKKHDYKTTLENNLELKQKELESHLANEPKILKVKATKEVENEKTNMIRKEIISLEKGVSVFKDNLTQLNIKKEELSQIHSVLSAMEFEYNDLFKDDSEIKNTLASYDIKLSNLLEIKFNLKDLNDEIKKTQEEIDIIVKSIDEDEKGSSAYKLIELKSNLTEEQQNLESPQRKIEKSKDEHKIWEIKKIQIIGSKSKDDSIEFYKYKLQFIKEEINQKLDNLYNKRESLIKEIFNRHEQLVLIRKELFKPVSEFTENLNDLQKKYEVKFDVNNEFKDFKNKFFNYISHNKSGSFYGIEKGNEKLDEIIDSTDLESPSSYIDFTTNILNALNYKDEEEMDLDEQLKSDISKKEFYDFIYNFNYIVSSYSLKLGNKSLIELSPGERGALLLIFYLLIDKSDIPLVIDQPEENLDNESVYEILVHFIKKAKENRQIIIITHNPNLAIVCDSAQIINMEIEKNNGNRVKYISGAIENKVIKDKVIDILEGTMPAFNNRKEKYLI